MGRRRRRSRGGGISRRRFLAGGLLGIGGASILGGTQAFSQVDATRATSVQTAGDENALLGVDPVTSVQAGVDDQNLVMLTNNADVELDVSVYLENPQQGAISDSVSTLSPDTSDTATISVDSESQTGSAALSFHVMATTLDDDSLEISLTRAVSVTEPPRLLQQVRDYTHDSNAAFTISYRVAGVSDFTEIEIEGENLDSSSIGTETYNLTSSETTISYPRGGGTDGGAAGDTYEFRFTVFDQSSEVTDLYTEVTTIANGQNPPGDDLGGENDPQLVEFSVTNNEENTNNRFTVDYEVAQLDDFEEVQVSFINTDQADDWADMTKYSDAAPSGAVVYPSEGSFQGGVNGDTYDVTIEVYNTSGIPVDSATAEIDAGSSDTVESS